MEISPQIMANCVEIYLQIPLKKAIHFFQTSEIKENDNFNGNGALLEKLDGIIRGNNPYPFSWCHNLPVIKYDCSVN